MNYNYCKKCGRICDKRSKICYDCYIKSMLGKNNKSYKHGRYTKKYYCIDCKKELSQNLKAKRCHDCANKILTRKKSRNDKMKKTLVKHHIYLKENSKETTKLTRRKHALLHQNAYEYIYKKYGKKGIDNYLKWFKRKWRKRK